MPLSLEDQLKLLAGATGTKDEIKNSIMNYLEYAFNNDNKVLGLSTVARRFNKSAAKFEGLNALIAELAAEKRLYINKASSGATVLIPQVAYNLALDNAAMFEISQDESLRRMSDTYNVKPIDYTKIER